MKTLILKLNATGDVVRTTTLLRRLTGAVTWITASGNCALLADVMPGLRCLSWEQRGQALDEEFDLLVNLEDDIEMSLFARTVNHREKFGAYTTDDKVVRYTDTSRAWFDMSLVSTFGRTRADELKLLNRRSYQEMIFEGLGFEFRGEPYLLPTVPSTGLFGDVAMAPVAGAVWPMKNWAFYMELKRELEARNFNVNILPKRPTLLEHIADVRGHRCLVGGDSLPMHLALGSGVRCVTIFNCTSPWEIYDYDLLTKIVSPRLSEFFYKRNFDRAATTAVSLEEVLSAVLASLSDTHVASGERTMAPA